MKARDAAAARTYVLRLIKIRLRSEKEIRDKLELKGFDRSIAGQAVDFLKRAGELDDKVFARLWAASRAKKPLGFARIRRELSLKGIEKETIEEALAMAREASPPEESLARLAESKLKVLRGLPRDKARARLYGILARRGFSPDQVIKAVEDALGFRRQEDEETDA